MRRKVNYLNLAVVLVALAATAASVLSVTIATSNSSRGFDPLRFPLQLVDNRIDGEPGPAIHIGDEVLVMATKCNVSGRAISIEGQTSWVSVDPPGSVITTGSGTAQRPAAPQCKETQFRNPIPPAVAARMTELASQGVLRQVWYITGKETPLATPNPISRNWLTQEIVVIP